MDVKGAHKVGRHLTNYSVSKYSGDYDHTDDPTDGSRGTKRLLSATFGYLASQGVDTEALWSQIRRISAETTKAIAAELTDVDAKAKRGCFHILGLDILFDKNSKAWLLEVNESPSLNTDSVYAAQGPYALEPPAVPTPEQAAQSEVSALVADAWQAMGRRASRICKCMSHHRPHLHAPCAVDLAAKFRCVGDVLEVVRRDLRSGGAQSCARLAADTCLEVLVDESGV